MIKGVAYFPLLKGSDPEELWKFWVEKFAPTHDPNNWPHLKKYVISRVIKQERGSGNMWGMAELYWDSQEAYEADMKALDNASDKKSHWKDRWESMVGEMTITVMEEKVIIDNGKLVI